MNVDNLLTYIINKQGRNEEETMSLKNAYIYPTRRKMIQEIMSLWYMLSVYWGGFYWGKTRKFGISDGIL